MAITQEKTDTELQIRRHFKASRERLFEAWTQEEALAQWFSPSSDFSVVVEAFELRVGGEYRIAMKPPPGEKGCDDAGEDCCVSGEYQVIDPPKQLVFSWSWRGKEEVSSLVTVDFFERDDGTEMVLTHERLPDVAARSSHEEGWNACIDHLAEFLSA